MAQEAKASRLRAPSDQKRAEVLAWARQRAEARERPPVVERRQQDEAVATNYWKGYIKRQLDSANMAMTKAIARAIVDEEKARKQADDDLMTIISDVRNRFDEMEARLAELRAATPTVKCDATPRHFDRGAFNGWRH